MSLEGFPASSPSTISSDLRVPVSCWALSDSQITTAIPTARLVTYLSYFFARFYAILQFFPIKGTHAYTLAAIEEIEAGDTITVKYTSQGYYSEGCLCATCHPEAPPLGVHKNPGPSSAGEGSGQKRGRRKRGGVRAKIAKILRAEQKQSIDCI